MQYIKKNTAINQHRFLLFNAAMKEELWTERGNEA